MQEKTVQIHFRATEKERLQFQTNAKKCGLSLSKYLRKLADGYEPKALPPIKYPELVDEQAVIAMVDSNPKSSSASPKRNG